MKRVFLALLLLGAAVRAQAVDWTGLWNSPDPNKQGFGYNLVQADDYIFGTFYVYGPSGAPTWLVAGLTLDGAGNYSGDVFAVQSATFYGSPWNPLAYMPYQTRVGTASFIPTNNYQATLKFTVTQANVGIGSSTVAIEREFLGTIATGGDYVGGQTGGYSGCTDTTANQSYTDLFDLTVSHLPDGSATFVFNSHKYGVPGTQTALSCTLAGTYVQHGQYYEIPSATYTCNNGLNTTATMTEIKATSLGIEGRFFTPNIGGGCAESANFSAVLK